MSDQQYRVIGKSGPGVDWRSLPGDTMIRYSCGGDGADPRRRLDLMEPHRCEWNDGRYEILEAISPPQAAPVVCLQWRGDEYSKSCVPGKIANYPPHANSRGQVMCWRDLDRSGYPTGPAYCTQACLDRAEAPKEDAGCWGSALHTANDFKGCTCPRTPPKDLAQKLSELERRVKALEGKLKPRGATDADE